MATTKLWLERSPSTVSPSSAPALKTSLIQVNGDSINETQETFTVTLSALSVPGTITRPVGFVTIVDNDILQVTVSDPSPVGEANEFATSASLSPSADPANKSSLMNYGVVTTGIAEPTEPARSQQHQRKSRLRAARASINVEVNVVER
jgi:hypothetical protein